MTQTNSIDEDCGCSSEKNQEFNESEFERIKDSMESTRDSLNKMFDTIQNMNLDFTRFNSLEDEVQKMTKYMYSGEFAKTLETALQKNDGSSKLSEIRTPTVPKMPNSPFMNNGFGAIKEKEPIGYVWIDENGEQKFSPMKPEDIISMPVYGE